MYTRFTSFRELIESFRSREGVAIKYADEDDDIIKEVTYNKLADLITSETFHVKAACSSVEVIRTEQTLESVIDIFAHVLAGCDVIMADPLVPEEFTDRALMAAEAAKIERESKRDSRGRLVSKQPEGELLFFTSGTTSRSKIVRLTSESFCTSAWSGQSMLACGEGDVILSILPLSHVFGFVCSLLWGLAYGACIALGRGVRHIIDDTLFFKPTILPAVPSLVSAMMKFNTLNPQLRVILIGAAPCTPETAAVLREKGIDVYFGYGLTETSSGIAITQDLDEPEALYPCPGADITLEPDGEVTVATPCMMQGYIGAIPMFDKDRFFTGDIGRFDEKGRLHLLGRKKDVLLMADGTKIFCPEYEEELAEMTGITDLGMIMKDGHAVLIAGKGSDKEALKMAVAEYNKTLQRSQQIYDVIISDHELPRTVTGKLKRYELAEQYK
ncbi:MAG: acyl--CoA ligase [Mogibacterium sp.]|nr:acyl--CoA ligase [Mogibacterium sp.]